MIDIGIVDYGVGNLGSIKNMLKKIGASSKLVNTPDDLYSVNKIILPGVGSFDTGMSNLHKSELVHVLQTRVTKEKLPILGICLGMQLLGISSEEGVMNGLGLIPIEIKKFPKIDNIKVPHMGWNEINPRKQHPITENTKNSRFYFVHSYYAPLDDQYTLSATSYGIDFSSIIGNDHIIGMQFHPEKSHSFGMKILKNFIDYF